MTSRFAIAAALSASLLGAGEAAAAESSAAEAAASSEADRARDNASSFVGNPTSSDSQDDWDVAFAPYVWMAGIKGDVAIPRDEGGVSVDKSFTDTLSNLNFAFMGALDVRYKRVIFLGDIIYLSVGAKAEGIRDPGFFQGHVDSSTFVGTAAAGYRVVDQDRLFLDLFAGGRVIALDADLDLVGPFMTRSASASATTISPLIGARFRAPLGEKWALGLYGDVGGIVKGADVKWQVMANVQYDISSHWTVIAGYRHMSINHDSSRFEFDVNLGGPILGFRYRFK